MAPATVPAPPIRMMAMNWTERNRSQRLGDDASEERGEQRPGDPGEERRDGEGHQFVDELVDPHHLGGDVAVPDRHEGPARPGFAAGSWPPGRR